MSVFTNTLLVAVALVLVALNGFFVAAEFALVRLRQTKVQELAAARGWRGRALLQVHSQLDAYLSACQLGITLASLGLGWVGEPAFARLLEPLLGAIGIDDPRSQHGIAFAFAFTVISFLHIVLGELAPKSMAIRNAERLSLWTAGPLYVFHWLMYPAIHALNGSANLVLRLFGVPPAGEGHDTKYSNDELRTILLRSRHGRGREQASMNTVLAQTLELGDLEASDLMRSRREMVVLHADDSYADVRRTIQTHRYSRYPLVEADGSIAGLVHVKDVLLEPPGADFPNRLREHLRRIERVREDLPAAELLRRFRHGTPHLAIVEDLVGDIAGFVTLEDVLEAMLGDITDEHELRRTGQVDRRILRLPDDSLLMRGDTPLYRLERELATQFDDSEEIDTVAGLLMQRLDRVPARGDSVEIDGHVLSVQRARGAQVELVRLRPHRAEAA